MSQRLTRKNTETETALGELLGQSPRPDGSPRSRSWCAAILTVVVLHSACDENRERAAGKDAGHNSTLAPTDSDDDASTAVRVPSCATTNPTAGIVLSGGDRLLTDLDENVIVTRSEEATDSQSSYGNVRIVVETDAGAVAPAAGPLDVLVQVAGVAPDFFKPGDSLRLIYRPLYHPWRAGAAGTLILVGERDLVLFVSSTWLESLNVPSLVPALEEFGIRLTAGDVACDGATLPFCKTRKHGLTVASAGQEVSILPGLMARLAGWTVVLDSVGENDTYKSPNCENPGAHQRTAGFRSRSGI